MATVLLVEDNEQNRDMLGRRLRKRGYTVEEAVDGRQGVDMALQAQPDLILMDISLPEMSGLEATQAIRADEAGRTMPIIALTAHAMQSDRIEALQAGCDEFLAKPVDLPVLLETMQRLLESGRPPPDPALAAFAAYNE